MTLDANGRLHEPSLRELTSELDGMRNTLEAKFNGLAAVIDERHERYAERDQANKDRVAAALAAAEKATEKTEMGLKEYKIGANEWRDTVKDLIADLREAQRLNTGKATGADAMKDESRANVAVLISGLTFIVLIVIEVLRQFR